MTVNVMIKHDPEKIIKPVTRREKKEKKKGHLQQLKSQKEMEWKCALKSNNRKTTDSAGHEGGQSCLR